jgi:hypothetical protein
MSSCAHDRALFDRIKQISNAVELVVPSRSFPSDYRLLRVPLVDFDNSSFGLAVVHQCSRSVPFWMQVSVLGGEESFPRRLAHVLSRRSIAREHRAALSGLELWVLLDFLSTQFDLLLTRTGMGWDRWLLTASRLARYGLATHAVEAGCSSLLRLDSEDLMEQNEDICMILSAMESGLLVLTPN